MDYSYFGASQQPYDHFLGMNSHSFAQTGAESDTTRSIVSFSACLLSLPLSLSLCLSRSHALCRFLSPSLTARRLQGPRKTPRFGLMRGFAHFTGGKERENSD